MFISPTPPEPEPRPSRDDLIAKLLRLAHTTDWNFNPAEYDGESTCPYDGHELDIHLHGGASCPSCGGEYEVGKNGIVLPSDNTVSEMSKEWPDTLPWGEKEQNYYRTADAPKDFTIPEDDAQYHMGWTDRTPYIYYPHNDHLYWGQPGQWHENLENWALAHQGIPQVYPPQGQPGVFGSVYTNPDDPTHRFQEVHRVQWPNPYTDNRIDRDLSYEHARHLEKRVGVPIGDTGIPDFSNSEIDWAPKLGMAERTGGYYSDWLGPQADEENWDNLPHDVWDQQPTHLYRAMSEEHFQQSLKDGYHQSDERGNWIGQHAQDAEDGQGDLWDEGDVKPEGTVAGRWAYPGYLVNAPNGIGRIVKIEVRPEDGWKQHHEADDEGGYYHTFKPIPVDRLVGWTPPLSVKPNGVVRPMHPSEYPGPTTRYPGRRHAAATVRQWTAAADDFGKVWRYRVPFNVWPSGSWEMGRPGTEHHQIVQDPHSYSEGEDPGQDFHDYDGGDFQGHMIFHPEHGESETWPTNMQTMTEQDYVTPELQDSIRAKAREMWNSHGPGTEEPPSLGYYSKSMVPSLQKAPGSPQEPRTAHDRDSWSPGANPATSDDWKPLA